MPIVYLLSPILCYFNVNEHVWWINYNWYGYNFFTLKSSCLVYFALHQRTTLCVCACLSARLSSNDLSQVRTSRTKFKVTLSKNILLDILMGCLIPQLPRKYAIIWLCISTKITVLVWDSLFGTPYMNIGVQLQCSNEYSGIKIFRVFSDFRVFSNFQDHSWDHCKSGEKIFRGGGVGGLRNLYKKSTRKKFTRIKFMSQRVTWVRVKGHRGQGQRSHGLSPA